MKNTMIHVCPSEPEFDFSTFTITQRICAEAVETENTAIVEACIRAAKEAGGTDLYLLDKQFVVEAIKEKIEREFEKEEENNACDHT